MPDLLHAVLANPLVATRHRAPSCEICRLHRTHPEVFAWLTEELLGETAEQLTQAEIAFEASRRTGLSITQSQVSNHKTRHLDPDLKDVIEGFVGHMAMMEVFSGCSAADMAMNASKMGVARLLKLLDDQDLEPKVAASVAAAMASLNSVLLRGERIDVERALDEVKLRGEEAREALAAGEFQEAFVAWVEQNHPDLLGALTQHQALAAAEAGDG
jgi:hypothetical protein